MPVSPGGGDGEAEAGKPKPVLVVAAERLDRRTALLTGYLRKKNSSNRWQKRYFEIVGQYWVYYKSHTAPEMLCAMDLWKASPPELLTPTGATGGTSLGGEEDGGMCEFSITWDRFRIFRASSPAEALRWVNAIQQVQALRPPDAVDRSMLAGPPTPALAGLAKVPPNGSINHGGGGAGGGGGGSGGPADWDKSGRKGGAGGSGKSPAGTPDTTEEGGVCGSCTIM